MSENIFRWQHRVTYAECTVGNHIYYSRYLDVLEAARGEFLRWVGAPLLELQAEGVIFPVVECHLRYRAPARYDDLLQIAVVLEQLSRVRVNFVYRVQRGEGELVLEGSTAHVCAGLDEKPRRMPPALLEKLRVHLRKDASKL